MKITTRIKMAIAAVKCLSAEEIRTEALKSVDISAEYTSAALKDAADVYSNVHTAIKRQAGDLAECEIESARDALIQLAEAAMASVENKQNQDAIRVLVLFFKRSISGTQGHIEALNKK